MGFNAKLFEIVLYPESFALEALSPILDGLSGLRHYAYCIHDQDEGKKDHVHVMLRMNDTHNSDYVSKWFNVSPSQVEKCKGKWADMLAYLTHSNATEKVQYDPEKVKSNFDWKTEAKKAGRGQRLQEIREGIVSGAIRKFNDHLFIDADEWALYKTKINSYHEYRLKMLKGVERDMESFYIWGESGSGKTSLAKQLAYQENMSLYVSSGSNDVLDNYEGQDCLILDDLRPSTLGLSDLLKMLDPHTASSVKSRYYNKVLECKRIVITTIMPMDEFYSKVFETEKEPLKQLQRRCRKIIHMTKVLIQYGEYDNSEGKYKFAPAIPNLILQAFNLTKLTGDDLLNGFKDALKSCSGAIDEIEKVMKKQS